MTRQRCSHENAVPVTSNGETVAALCPDCDRQLPAAWLTCPHNDALDVREFGEPPPGTHLCNGCGTAFWPKESANV